MPTTPDTFSAALAAAAVSDPTRGGSRPLITAYDDETGERTELSVTTYANWVSKTANLLTDEYLLEHGDTIRLDLPAHWLVPVFLGAAWAAGIAVTTDTNEATHLVVTGPQPDPDAAPDVPVLACSLRPFAVRFTDPLPEAVDDYGDLWPNQPDVFTAPVSPSGRTIAEHTDGVAQSQATLLGRAAQEAAAWPGGRLLTDVHPAEEWGTTTWLAALVGGGSVVMVTNADDEQWSARREGEQTTTELRVGSGSVGPV